MRIISKSFEVSARKVTQGIIIMGLLFREGKGSYSMVGAYWSIKYGILIS